jgi:anti-sigma factor ChrR (cupin superfamily)
MHVNADFSKRVTITPADYRWVDSPTAGVERMMLDRIGDEVARATSLVRYAPNSTFPRHVHGGGEEFLVLDGEFGDEHATYPSGTYVRNPIGTSHAPRVGGQGCTIFVKLRQFEAGDDRQFALDTRHVEWSPASDAKIETSLLHEHGPERVSLVKLAPGAALAAAAGGEELFVLDGTLADPHGSYPAGSWIRNPAGWAEPVRSDDAPVLLYRKTGHLTGVELP